MKYNSIRPGQIWLDTDGKSIQAHGGSIITVGDTFYLYGENKEKTKPGSGIWHWGVRCYASKDLYNWEDKGIIIPPNEEDDSSPLHPAQYNEAFDVWTHLVIHRIFFDNPMESSLLAS